MGEAGRAEDRYNMRGLKFNSAQIIQKLFYLAFTYVLMFRNPNILFVTNILLYSFSAVQSSSRRHKSCVKGPCLVLTSPESVATVSH